MVNTFSCLYHRREFKIWFLFSPLVCLVSWRLPHPRWFALQDTARCAFNAIRIGLTRNGHVRVWVKERVNSLIFFYLYFRAIVITAFADTTFCNVKDFLETVFLAFFNWIIFRNELKLKEIYFLKCYSKRLYLIYLFQILKSAVLIVSIEIPKGRSFIIAQVIRENTLLVLKSKWMYRIRCWKKDQGNWTQNASLCAEEDGGMRIPSYILQNIMKDTIFILVNLNDRFFYIHVQTQASEIDLKLTLKPALLNKMRVLKDKFIVCFQSFKGREVWQN